MANSSTMLQLDLDADLEARLKTLAERSGVSLSELAQDVLRAHADEQARVDAELAEDERRWQRYRAGGETVPLESVRERLRSLAVR